MDELENGTISGSSKDEVVLEVDGEAYGLSTTTGGVQTNIGIIGDAQGQVALADDRATCCCCVNGNSCSLNLT